MRTYTINEAAELTGLSRKAIARRIERGSLRCLVRDGRRRIPRSELLRLGLLAEEDEVEALEFDPSLLLRGRSEPSNLPVPVDSGHALAAVIRELFDRFERQATEIAGFRALTAQAESLRLTSELADLRTRIAELETQRRPKELSALGQAARPPDERTQRGPSSRELWLPTGARNVQGAGPEAKTQAQLEPELARLRARIAELEARRRQFGRAPRLAVEAVFIAAVAVGVWLADLDPPAIFAFMAAAWIIVAVIESVNWRQRR